MTTDRMLALANGLLLHTNELKHAQNLGISFGLHIGFGTYSHVYKAKHNSKAVALKSCDNTGSVRRLVNQELIVYGILKERPHKNIIKFLGKYANFDSSRVWVLLEWFEGVDMAEKLMIKGCAFEESIARSYFTQLVDGLKFLHSLAIVHRDIKLDNILIGFDTNADKSQKNECIKIIDFGFAKKVELKEGDESALCSSRLGTEVYMAPEMFTYKDNRDYDAFKSDIFSLAIVLFALLFNQFPDREVVRGSFEVQPKPVQIPKYSEYKVSESAKQLILNMCCEDSTKRLNINQILDSEWMQSLHT